MQKNCKATTKTGKRCQAKPITGSEYCFSHDANSAAARAAAHKLGGERTRTPHGGDLAIIPTEINTIKDARKILAYALAELAPMENSLQRVRAYIAIFDSYNESIKTGELAERLAAIESILKARTA